MAGPEGEIAAGAWDRGYLRASHADREQVIETLKAAFVHGRLAKASAMRATSAATEATSRPGC